MTALSQKVTFGVVTGSSLRDDFPSGTDVRPPLVTCPQPVCASMTVFNSADASARLILGPKLELAFSRQFSIEVEALHRAVGRTTRIDYSPPLDFGNGVTVASQTSTGTDWAWEIPVLANYKLKLLQSSSFLELGPTFRPAENNEQYGISAGAGVEIRAKSLKIAPRIRYTRWIDKDYGPDPIFPLVRPHPDQVSLIVGVSQWTQSSAWASIFGKDLSVGALAGLGLSDDFQTDVSFLGGVPAYRSFSKSRSPILGVSLEYEPVRNLSIQVNGLYRPLHLTGETLISIPEQGVYPREGETVTVLTWEFPILGRYRLPVAGEKPFVEFGPSFRAIGNLNGTKPSKHGATVGVGVGIGVGKARLSPTLRYTQWAQDETAGTRTNPNQLELLFGFSF